MGNQSAPAGPVPGGALRRSTSAGGKRRGGFGRQSDLPPRRRTSMLASSTDRSWRPAKMTEFFYGHGQ